MEIDDKTKKRVEEIVGDAYDIGHTHGTNPMRMMEGKKLQKLNTGWGKYSEKILKIIEEKSQRTRDDLINDLIIWIGDIKDETAFNQWQIRKTTLVKKLHSMREK